ncbi:hypothetical protein LguiA_024071 [Lonicera macranthoides]
MSFIRDLPSLLDSNLDDYRWNIYSLRPKLRVKFDFNDVTLFSTESMVKHKTWLLCEIQYIDYVINGNMTFNVGHPEKEKVLKRIHGKEKAHRNGNAYVEW